MAKMLLILFSAFLLPAHVCASGPGRPVDCREAVLATASSQLQVREATGKNDGEQVEKYLEAVGRKRGDAWCAAFVYWCFSQNEIEAPKSGWSPSWFPLGNTIYIRGGKGNKIPLPADVIGIYFSNLGRIAHVGILESWGEKYAITIEGNTSDANYGNSTREGQGVYRKRRLKSQIYKISRWT